MLERYRIFVQFICHRSGEQERWEVTFIEGSRPVCRKRMFASDEKVRQLFERAAASKMLEDRTALDIGIRDGRGGFFIALNGEEYQRLKSAR